MARVCSKPLAQGLCAAADHEVAGEPPSELLGREGFLHFIFAVFGERGELATLEQDQRGGGASEVGVALQGVGSLGVTGLDVEAHQLAQRNLEDLQLLFQDQGKEPLVGTGVHLELDGEVREGSIQGHLASEWSGNTEERALCSVPVARARTESTTRPSATTTPRPSPGSALMASASPRPATSRT